MSNGAAGVAAAKWGREEVMVVTSEVRSDQENQSLGGIWSSLYLKYDVTCF